MSQINYIKVGGTTYSIPGSGGGLYDAVIRRMVVYNSSGDQLSDSLDIMDGDFYTCLSKLENNEYLTIGVYESHDQRNAGQGILTLLHHCDEIEVNNGNILLRWYSEGGYTHLLTWTDSNITHTRVSSGTA
jgi:hypothetical protein